MSEFVAHGAVRQLWRICKWPGGMYQILLEGPAGTGKTRGLLEWVNFMAEEYPGIRVLFLRKTKGSLAESVLDTWENHVLGPAIVGEAGVHNRQFYHYPNGTHIVLGGVANEAQETKTFSTQFDIVVFFEGREMGSMRTWNKLARANRNFKMPWQIRIADTNPGSQFHWLNTHFPRAAEGGAYRRIPKKFHEHPPYTIRCEERHVTVAPKPEELAVDGDGKFVVQCPQCDAPAKGGVIFRLLSRFKDNPLWWDHDKHKYRPNGLEYIEGALALTDGAEYANLYEGKWSSEEGAIYGKWDPLVHVIDPEDAPREYKWFLGAFDQGIRHPGCLQVWGVIDDKMWLVYELYRTDQDIDWWAQRVLEVHERYPLQALVCDHEIDYVSKFNDFMGEKRGRDGDRIARNANKSIRVGISMMRWALSRREGGPHMFVVRGYGEAKDRKRVAQSKPASFEEEIGSYIWKISEEGKPQREEPDPTCADHSMDTARYAAMYMWGKELSPINNAPAFKDGSLGSLLRHNQVWEDEEMGIAPGVE